MKAKKVVFSRKCSVKIHEMMLNNAYKNYLYKLKFFDTFVAINSSGESGLEQ